jgi:predicted nucleic acid-binding Zn ribbon protein
MERISHILPRVLQNPGAEFKQTGRHPVADWEKLWAETCGDDAKQFSHAIACENGVLKVEVTNSCWLMELKRQKPRIKKALEQRTGIALKDLRFVR